MKILVINAGSSSLKFQLIDMDNEQVIAKGICEEIGGKSRFKLKVPGREDYKTETALPTHGEALKLVLDTLVDPKLGVIASVDEIGAVGHRVLHGGKYYSESVIVNDDVKKVIRDCFPLGPLHNPANLMGIEACINLMPNTPNVAVFDTAFHATIPDYAFMYAVPYEDYEEFGIRKYGFHGTSHRFVSKQVEKYMGKPATELKVITCHIGNGSSIAAVEYGKCVDTTMGLTPLDGLPMGTRTGSIDPAIVPLLMEKRGMTTKEVDNYLNKKSGMLGVSGVSSDFRDLTAAINEGNERAKLAVKMLSYSIKKYIGSYAAAMNGVDAIVFTAGVGENIMYMREWAVDGLDYMGVKLDKEKNNALASYKDVKEGFINADDSKVKIIVIPTNEELMIAMDTEEIVSAL